MVDPERVQRALAAVTERQKQLATVKSFYNASRINSDYHPVIRSRLEKWREITYESIRDNVNLVEAAPFAKSTQFSGLFQPLIQFLFNQINDYSKALELIKRALVEHPELVMDKTNTNESDTPEVQQERAMVSQEHVDKVIALVETLGNELNRMREEGVDDIPTMVKARLNRWNARAYQVISEYISESEAEPFRVAGTKLGYSNSWAEVRDQIQECIVAINLIYEDLLERPEFLFGGSIA